MRTREFRSFISASLLFIAIAVAELRSQDAPPFGVGFKDRSMAHVLQLVALGKREAGSNSERNAARYIAQQMKQASLTVVGEPFTFQSYVLNHAVLEAGSEKADIVRLGFNPYSTTAPISGELAFVTATEGTKTDLENKLVVIPGTEALSRVSFSQNAKLIVCLSSADFQRLRATGATSGRINVRGTRSRKRSSNVVGILGKNSSAREILVTAHYDSFGGPGANDNASGVGVLIDLARYFHSLRLPPDVSMRFVDFGAEEFGLLGSKAYLRKHHTELQKCELLFNIDQVGGDGAIYTDTGGGVRGLPSPLLKQLPGEFADKATTDPKVSWLLPLATQRPLWANSNVPEWLRIAVSRAGSDLGREVLAADGSGSDHRVFVQSGVVATDITVEGGAETHTPADVPDAVHPESMELAARLVAGVIQDLLRSKFEDNPK
jgi:hypothetical protein